MNRTAPRGSREASSLVPIPGLRSADVAAIQSLLKGAGFFFCVHTGIGEAPDVIFIRAVDLPAVKTFLTDYRTTGGLWGQGGPIPW